MPKLNLSALNIQHVVLIAAGVLATAAAAVAAQASSICAVAATGACTATLTNIATSVGAVAAVVTTALGLTSGSLLKPSAAKAPSAEKKEETRS